MADGLIITIFLIGILILFTTFISLRIIQKTALLHNAFGYMCASQSIANGIFGCCFVFWATPVMAFFPEIQQSFFGYFFGQLFFLSANCVVWLHLCKSVNRAIAIIFPIQYYKHFTIKTAYTFIGSALFLALLSSSTSLFIYKCNYYFHPTLYKWKLRFYPECWEVNFFDHFTMTIVNIGSLVCDLVTFGHLIIFRKKLSKNQTSKSKNDKMFFIQTCCSTICFFILFVFWNYFGNIAETLTATVLFKTVTWESFQLSHQIIFIAFTLKGISNISSLFKTCWPTTVKPSSNSIVFTADQQ